MSETARPSGGTDSPLIAYAEKSVDLQDFVVPGGFGCNPAETPSGNLWSSAVPKSWEWLDRKHAITMRVITGLEIQNFKWLNVRSGWGPPLLRVNFWSMLESLPNGSVIMFSKLDDIKELQTLFPQCNVGNPGLAYHPCLARIPESMRAERMELIARRMVSICRHHAGFVSGPKALAIPIGRFGWVPWDEIVAQIRWEFTDHHITSEFLATLWFTQARNGNAVATTDLGFLSARQVFRLA